MNENEEQPEKLVYVQCDSYTAACY